MKIGFVGLGIMGKPMAKNLLKAGYEVVVSTVNSAHKELVELGATAMTNQEIGDTCDIVMTMLPNSPEVKEVMIGKNGIGKYMKKGTIFVDMSSINPVASKEIAGELQKNGIEMLDAPVSGGEPKAIDGTLSFMVGGKKEIFEKVKPILEKMGSSVVLCGDIGAGNTTKLANQIIVAGNIQALCEAMNFAKKAGVDTKLVFEAIKGGLAGSTVMNAKMPMIIEGNDNPGFKIDLHIKDLNNTLECAHEIGAPVPMTAEVKEIMEWLHSIGDGSKDHSAIIKYYDYLTKYNI